MASSLTVPAAPFRRILQAKLEGLENNDEIVQMRHHLSMRTGVSERILYRILKGEQENISFDNADGIVTGILGPMAWHEDETLSEIYRRVDMKRVDWAFPTSPVVEGELRMYAAEQVAEHGTIQAAAESIGIPVETLSRYLRRAA